MPNEIPVGRQPSLRGKTCVRKADRVTPAVVPMTTDVTQGRSKREEEAKPFISLYRYT